MNISVTILTTSRIEVAWVIPNTQYLNGELKHSVLQLREKNNTSENFTILRTTQSLDSSFVFEDLHPFYDYSVAIAAETVDLGPFSEPVTWKMPEDGKERV